MLVTSCNSVGRSRAARQQSVCTRAALVDWAKSDYQHQPVELKKFLYLKITRRKFCEMLWTWVFFVRPQMETNWKVKMFTLTSFFVTIAWFRFLTNRQQSSDFFSCFSRIFWPILALKSLYGKARIENRFLFFIFWPKISISSLFLWRFLWFVFKDCLANFGFETAESWNCCFEKTFKDFFSSIQIQFEVQSQIFI